MELRHLRYFVAVAEELHFTRAAARLHIGQPPLSQQIQALENELGVKLFDRTKRSVKLTEAGQHLLVKAREILDSSHTVVAELQQIASGRLGELRVGFTSSGLLSKEVRCALDTFHEQCPRVNLQLHEMYTYKQFEALGNDELDIGFVRLNGQVAHPGLSVRLIRRDRLFLIVPKNHRFAGKNSIRLHDCRNEAFISFPRNAGASLTGHLTHLCAQVGFAPNIVQEAREALTQIGLVASGIGVTVLAEPLARLALEDISFIPIEDKEAYMDMMAIWKTRTRSPRISRFMSILSSQKADQMSNGTAFPPISG